MLTSNLRTKKLLVISELSQKYEEVEYYLEHFLQGMTQNFDEQI